MRRSQLVPVFLVISASLLPTQVKSEEPAIDPRLVEACDRVASFDPDLESTCKQALVLMTSPDLKTQLDGRALYDEATAPYDEAMNAKAERAATAAMEGQAGNAAVEPQGSIYYCFGLQATIIGTTGSDDITGTSGSDVVVGRAGSDDIRTHDSEDYLCGNADDDQRYAFWNYTGGLRGGYQDDNFHGDWEADDLYALNGHDYLSGGPGSDSLFPGYGYDRLVGGDGHDYAYLCDDPYDQDERAEASSIETFYGPSSNWCTYNGTE